MTNQKTNRFLEDVKKQIVVLFNTTKKIDSDFSEDFDLFVNKIESEGLNSQTLSDMKKMALILDNKINSKKFEERQKVVDFNLMLNSIIKQNISQKQKNSIEKLKVKLKNGADISEVLDELSTTFSNFSEEINLYREKSKLIVGEEHKHFKDGTQDILAGDIGAVSRSMTRDVLRIANQLKRDYPEDKYVLELFEETKKIYNDKTTQLFTITDIFSKLSLYSIQLQKREKLKAEQYLYDVNSKLESLFENINVTNNSYDESELLTNELDDKLKNNIKDIKNSTEEAKDIPELKKVINSKLDKLQDQMNDFKNKQINLQKKQRQHINNLENNLQEAMVRQKELQESLKEEKEASSIDELTKLPNRKAYLNYITKAHKYWIKQPYPLSIILLDIDKFKGINDTFGHNVGDAALKNVGQIVKRITDKKCFFGRYGGEEFIIVCPKLSKSKAALFAEHIRKEIYKTKFQVGKGENRQNINITASFGIAEFSKNNNDITSTFDKADKALYFAKNDGRNSVCLDNNGNIINYTSKFQNR